MFNYRFFLLFWIISRIFDIITTYISVGLYGNIEMNYLYINTFNSNLTTFLIFNLIMSFGYMSVFAWLQERSKFTYYITNLTILILGTYFYYISFHNLNISIIRYGF